MSMLSAVCRVLFAGLAGFALFACAVAAEATSENAADRSPPIIVIGDIHGDYDAYIEVMKAAGLIDNRKRWDGDDEIFVQLGDVPDRGPDTRKILDHLMQLKKRANQGQIVPLVGNHEAMNARGDLRYVDPGEYAAFKTSRSKRLRDAYFRTNKDFFTGKYQNDEQTKSAADIRAAFDAEYPLGYVEHREAWSPSGKYGKWVAGNDTVRVIDGYLFVHGGISPTYVSASPDEINAKLRAALKGETPDAVLFDEDSPLWYRGLATESEGGWQEVEAILAAFGVERIIIGHTPSVKGVKTLYGGRVVIVDTGMSSFYGGVRSFLRIDNGRLTAWENGVVRDVSDVTPIAEKTQAEEMAQ